MPLSPLLTQSLPALTPGPHKHIAYAYLRSPPAHPYSHPLPVLKGTTTPALTIEQVSYALYYPCERPRRRWWGGSGKGVWWVPEPTGEFVKGYERFVGKYGWLVSLLRLVVGHMTIPAYQNALLQPPKSKYPLVIFSHGLAGTRNTYSTYCSALASEGYVVLAVEHADGSAPAVIIPGKDGAKGRTLLYTRKDDLDWKDAKNTSLYHFREMQLETRTREIYEAYDSFKKLLATEENASTSIAGVTGDKRVQWVGAMRGKVDFEDVQLTGHSFGGGTIMNLLQTPPPPHLARMPVSKAVALDPWLEPIPLPAASTAASPSMPPLLVINSPGFTVWRDHFQRLLGMCEDAEAWLTSLIGSNHQTFSDFPLLLAPGKPLNLLRIIHKLSSAFIKGELSAADEVKGKPAVKGKFKKDENGKMIGKEGEVIVHLIGRE